MEAVNQIIIVVAGKAASGKSTIAALIYDCLKKYGFNDVNIEDEEDGKIFNFMDQKIHALQEKKNTVINIKSQQVNKKFLLSDSPLCYAEKHPPIGENNNA